MTFKIKCSQKILNRKNNEYDSIFNKYIIKDYNITANSPKEAVKSLKKYLKQPLEILEIKKITIHTKLKITYWGKLIKFLRRLKKCLK